MDALQISLNGECLLAHSGPFMLSMWRGPLTQETIATHYLVAGELRRKYTRFGFMVIIEPESPPPKLDGRKALGDFYKQIAPNVLSLALVIRGEGFLLSAARALMSAVLAPYQFPSRIFSNTDAAVPWMANYVTQRHFLATRDDLRQLVASAYAQYTWHMPVDPPRRVAV